MYIVNHVGLTLRKNAPIFLFTVTLHHDSLCIRMCLLRYSKHNITLFTCIVFLNSCIIDSLLSVCLDYAGVGLRKQFTFAISRLLLR